MGTRATYHFETKDRFAGFARSAFIYCHWDNYPSGAAIRFGRMIEAMTTWDAEGYRMVEVARGGLLFAFIRGNDDAEPTGHHDTHGDTEYRYDLWVGDSGLPMIHMASRKWTDGPEWHGEWTGYLVDFVNQNGGPRLVQCCEPSGGAYVATLDKAKEIAAGYASRAAQSQWEHQQKEWSAKAKAWADAALLAEPVAT